MSGLRLGGFIACLIEHKSSVCWRYLIVHEIGVVRKTNEFVKLLREIVFFLLPDLEAKVVALQLPGPVHICVQTSGWDG